MEKLLIAKADPRTLLIERSEIVSNVDIKAFSLID